VVELPPVGTRVSLRYRLPAGSERPLNDVVGHLVEVVPTIRVRTKSAELVDVSPGDVVAVRVLTDAPVRNSQIRNLEHAAALAWPGLEQRWLDGWLLRFSGGPSHRANSAVPLEVHANLTAVPAIVAWYRERHATPWLSVPDRLVRLPEATQSSLEVLVMTRELDPDVDVVEPAVVAARPDDQWLRSYQRDIDVDVLTAVIDGEVSFANRASAAVGRGAVTTAPDGTRWAGLAAVHVASDERRKGHARALCATLLAWGIARGATRAYAQVLADNAAALTLYQSMGFRTQHRMRYVDGRTL
jgi:ribosomal protein S18 acetylase RimI-like enzyme